MQLLQTARDFLGVLAAIERGNAKITFALRAETVARRDDYI